MKTTLLLTAILSSVTLGYAQTTPSATPAAATAGSPAGVSGTKNVGSDRADAPQAPGMQAAGPATSASRPGSAKKARHSDRKAQGIKADPPVK